MKGPLLTAIVAAIAMTSPSTTSDLGSLRLATGWINSPPLTANGLRGRVVLVQFWTYSCINWIRTLPYLRAWAEKYREQGLVVIGVHSPEFDFEKVPANVRGAAKSFGVGYPIATDNKFAVWQGFENQYWPALYLLDGRGRVRYRKFGEGGYVESERMIQKLLGEAGARDVGRQLVSVTGSGVEAAADGADIESPETYLGSERRERQVAPGAKLQLNQWALEGEWTMERQATVLDRAAGKLVYRFHARDLNLVMAPDSTGRPVRFRVLIDGNPPGPAHGADVDEHGNGRVILPRMYQLIRQPNPIKDREFQIEFLDPGVQAFVLTFG
jgi:thiol-disulfide isomerase/thioredoxin